MSRARSLPPAGAATLAMTLAVALCLWPMEAEAKRRSRSSQGTASRLVIGTILLRDEDGRACVLRWQGATPVVTVPRGADPASCARACFRHAGKTCAMLRQ